MARIVFDDSRSIADMLHSKENRRTSFATFNKLMDEGVFLKSELIKQNEKDFQEIQKLQAQINERKADLLYENLDLIWRNRERIKNTPRYAAIDVPYALDGGGAYVGPLRKSMAYCVQGCFLKIYLNLKMLLELWEKEFFQEPCSCGGSALIRWISGSPLSGTCCWKAVCPQCRSAIHGKGGNFGRRYWAVGDVLAKSLEEFAEKFQGKWQIAEEEMQRELAKTQIQNPSPSDYFSTDEAPCEMETMIQELRQMEAEKRIGESQTADKTEKEK
ncbi:hypothetical protein [uncultured Fibrobacter sp.]|uniref:hypothetical protein n=1 Tax=uncultured Fibrobacter sp. TaxID=261512 RepID=UPI002803B7BA|nr:hypothetical protein [uncultured Fibrobacter sp.]